MSSIRRAIALGLIQLALISAIAGKYLYERVICPRVWVQVQQIDPDDMTRGRYFYLNPVVDACALDKKDADYTRPFDTGNGTKSLAWWSWPVKFVARNGILVPILADPEKDTSDAVKLGYNDSQDCSHIAMNSGVEFYVPERATPPFRRGAEVWMQATVPPQGPPRPISLAVKTDGAWMPLKLN